MTAVRSTLRAETRKTGPSPVVRLRILRDLGELLYDDLNKAELFITMFYMKFSPETRILNMRTRVTTGRCCCVADASNARRWTRMDWFSASSQLSILKRRA